LKAVGVDGSASKDISFDLMQCLRVPSQAIAVLKQ